jgi:hypothetical protein
MFHLSAGAINRVPLDHQREILTVTGGHIVLGPHQR